MASTLIQINRNGMGAGDEGLGIQLITNYITLLNQDNFVPKFVTFYNSGVKLLCENSPLLAQLKDLEAKGTKLIACKTCLKHFDLTEQLATGLMGTMQEIIELQKICDKVITL